jgi:hypothetical protein
MDAGGYVGPVIQGNQSHHHHSLSHQGFLDHHFLKPLIKSQVPVRKWLKNRILIKFKDNKTNKDMLIESISFCDEK